MKSKNVHCFIDCMSVAVTGQNEMKYFYLKFVIIKLFKVQQLIIMYNKSSQG